MWRLRRNLRTTIPVVHPLQRHVDPRGFFHVNEIAADKICFSTLNILMWIVIKTKTFCAINILIAQINGYEVYKNSYFLH